MLFFEVDQADTANGGVASVGVVTAVDVAADGLPGGSQVSKDLTVDELLLERAEEGLCDGVVPALSPQLLGDAWRAVAALVATMDGADVHEQGGVSASDVRESGLDQIAAKLNTRPRKVLRYNCPRDAFSEVLR
jgi:hypothetical protein